MSTVRASLLALTIGPLTSCSSSITPDAASDAPADQLAVIDATSPSDVPAAPDATTPPDAPSIPDATSLSDVPATPDVPVAPASTISCPADAGIVFPASLAACTHASDCVAVVHGLNCCGAMEFIGINIAQQTAYSGPEMACEMRVAYNTCGCPPPPPVAQDGHMVPFGTDAGVDCVVGVCLTHAP
jgi:hypothetical protein